MRPLPLVLLLSACPTSGMIVPPLAPVDELPLEPPSASEAAPPPCPREPPSRGGAVSDAEARALALAVAATELCQESRRTRSFGPPIEFLVADYRVAVSALSCDAGAGSRCPVSFDLHYDSHRPDRFRGGVFVRGLGHP